MMLSQVKTIQHIRRTPTHITHGTKFYRDEAMNQPALSPIKILIVEDTEICQKIALLMFDQPEYLADLAVTGKEALSKYSQGYDVILLDLGLPDMLGIDVCRHIREKIGDTKTPIIAYSTISDILHQECLDAGFSEVLTKPAGKEVLENTIKKLMKEK